MKLKKKGFKAVCFVDIYGFRKYGIKIEVMKFNFILTQHLFMIKTEKKCMNIIFENKKK